MTSRKSTYSTASRYNTYSSINNLNGANSTRTSLLDNNSNSIDNNYLIPRPPTMGHRSPSPAVIDAELSSLKKQGKDYHVSVNLNALISANQNAQGTQPKAALRQTNIVNQQTMSRSSLGKSQAVTQNGTKGGSYYPDQRVVQLNPAGLGRTVLTLNGGDDSELYELHLRHQSQKNLLAAAAASSQGHQSYYPPSLTPAMNVSPQVTAQQGGYAVKSISSSDVSHSTKQPKDEKVEFDLHLMGQMRREAPVQRSRTWEVMGTVPVKPKNPPVQSFMPRREEKIVRSRTAARAIDDNGDYDEYDGAHARTVKGTAQELEDLLLSHPLIRDTPGRNVEVKRQKDQLVDPPRGPAEGLINMDIIEEKVELIMKNGQANVLITVQCSRTVPLEDSRHFKKSSVMVVKSMHFDMTESERREELYRSALRKQEKSPTGRLDQQETNRLYKALMQLVKEEESEGLGLGGFGDAREREGGSQTRSRSYKSELARESDFDRRRSGRQSAVRYRDGGDGGGGYYNGYSSVLTSSKDGGRRDRNSDYFMY